MYLLDCVNNIAEKQYKEKANYINFGANYAVVLKSMIQNFDQ